jgi:hypothetical protein
MHELGIEPASNAGLYKGAAMILTFILSRLQRAPAFAWSPALDLHDHAIRSTLLPGTHS